MAHPPLIRSEHMKAFEESLFHMAAEDVTEEKLEQIFRKVNVRDLVEDTGFRGTIARFVLKFPSDARLVILSALAAVIERDERIPPIVRFALASSLRAGPAALDAISKEQLGTEDVEKKVKEVEAAIKKGERDAEGNFNQMIAWVDTAGAVSVVHLDLPHTHPMPRNTKGNTGVPHGPAGEVLKHRHGIDTECATCFGPYFGKKPMPNLLVPVTKEEKAKEAAEAEAKAEEHEALSGLTHWHDQVSADAYAAVYARLEAEAKPFQDMNEGFEGEAGHIMKAMAWFLKHDPVGAEKLFAGERGAEVLRLIEESKDKAAGDRDGKLREQLDTDLAKVLIEYDTKHPDRLAEAKDWLDRVSPFVPEEVRKGGSRKKVTDWIKKTAEDITNVVLRYIFGFTLVFILVLALLGVFARPFMVPVTFWVFILTLAVTAFVNILGVGSTKSVDPLDQNRPGEGRLRLLWSAMRGVGIVARAGIVFAVILYYSGVFAIAFEISTLFASEPLWFWTGFAFALANVLVWDVLALRIVDDVWDAIRTSSIFITAFVKEVVPGGETGPEYEARKAREAEAAAVKTIRFKRIVFQVGMILTFASGIMFLGGACGLEIEYIRYAVGSAIIIVGAAYARSVIFVGDSTKGIPHDVEEEVRVYRVSNIHLVHRLITLGIFPAFIILFIGMAIDPFRLSGTPDRAAENSITWYVRGWMGRDAMDPEGTREAKIVQATSTFTNAGLNAANRKANQSARGEVACEQAENFLRTHPTFCNDPLVQSGAICVAEVECGLTQRKVPESKFDTFLVKVWSLTWRIGLVVVFVAIVCAVWKWFRNRYLAVPVSAESGHGH